VFLNLGIVVGYTINSYLDYYTVPFVVIAILVTFFVGFPFAADSPKHLMAQNKTVQALGALKYFRGQDQQDFEAELKVLESQATVDTKAERSKLTLKDFSCKSARKAIFIGIFINFLSIMNGIGAVNSYSWAIFQTTGSTLSPEDSTIILGVALLIGAIISILLNDRAGRRILMGTSALGCGISLSITVVFLYLKDKDLVSDALAWIPLVCISLFMLIGAYGITSLHFSITSEVLAHKIRGIISSFCLMENWLLAFLLVKVRSSLLYT
jgi:Sugar (and other) transporter